LISAQPSATRFTGATYTRERPLLVSLDDTDPGLIRTLAAVGGDPADVGNTDLAGILDAGGGARSTASKNRS
jgi:hypothetical protein